MQLLLQQKRMVVVCLAKRGELWNLMVHGPAQKISSTLDTMFLLHLSIVFHGIKESIGFFINKG